MVHFDREWRESRPVLSADAILCMTDKVDLQMVRLLASGLGYGAAAARMSSTESAVRQRTIRLQRVLRASTRAELIAIMRMRGLVDEDVTAVRR